MLTTYAQGLSDFADAVEADDQAAGDEAVALIGEADNLSGELIAAVDELEAECA